MFHILDTLLPFETRSCVYNKPEELKSQRHRHQELRRGRVIPECRVLGVAAPPDISFSREMSRHPRCWTSTLLCLFFVVTLLMAYVSKLSFCTSRAVSYVATCLRHGYHLGQSGCCWTIEDLGWWLRRLDRRG